MISKLNFILGLFLMLASHIAFACGTAFTPPCPEPEPEPICGTAFTPPCETTEPVCGTAFTPPCPGTEPVCGTAFTPPCSGTEPVCGGAFAPPCGTVTAQCGTAFTPACGDEEAVCGTAFTEACPDTVVSCGGAFEPVCDTTVQNCGGTFEPPCEDMEPICGTSFTPACETIQPDPPLVMNPSYVPGTVTFIHSDILGSPVAATDINGYKLWDESYQAYGEKRINSLAADENNVSYTGHVENKDTGLVYMGARHYDPIIGRFMGVDPVGFTTNNVMSFNRYSYVNNNPYKYIDPDGRAAFLAWFATPAGIAALEYTGSALIGILGGAAVHENVIEPMMNESGGDSKSVKDKKRKYTKKDRERLADSADGECEYCGDDVTMKPGSGKSMEGDHIDPWVNGGKTDDENGASSCRDCNRAKGKKTLGTGEGQYTPKNPNDRIKGKMNGSQ